MSTATKLPKEYEKMLNFREGARYCKMDLHTHSPASECSDFGLPDNMEARFPDHQKNTVKSREECYQFIKGLAEDNIKPNPFKTAYGKASTNNRPYLTKRPKLDTLAIKRIAQVWNDEIECLNPSEMPELDKKLKKQRDNFVVCAFSDLRKYLKSLYFPEEFVLRCYIEGLQLVALTDHNHPGYIVARLPELGTWFSALQEANKPYIEDFNGGNRSGEKVLKSIRNRLKLAKKNLVKEEQHLKSNKKSNESKKRLKAIPARQKYVDELIKYWDSPENKPRTLFLIPGTEITVSNVHLLSLFPPEWYVPGRIGGILGDIGIPEEQWGRAMIAAASASVQDTITFVDEGGGIAIPAHSNSDFKGLLRLFTKGLALTKILEHPALMALEIKKGSVLKGKNACETLKSLHGSSLNVDYPKSLCFVKGSDAHECRIEYKGKGDDMGERFTHVKMDIRPKDTEEEIFRSLRLALICGQSRIIESPPEDGYNYTAGKKNYLIRKSERIKLLECERLRPTIIGLTVEGAGCYANDLKVRFNPYLNCIIGSGGKSTIVRIIGYAFGAQSFMPQTKNKWLPELVRVFWRRADKVYCLEREGRSIDPNADHVKVRCFELSAGNKWKVNKDLVSTNLSELIEIWPPPDTQDNKENLTDFEDDLIQELIQQLKFRTIDRANPLLVNQPRNIFNTRRLFNAVLSEPYLKARQIIWSSGSPNVGTALDAEKIIITGEKRKGKQMGLVCGGDLHEDEIREQYLNHFEGGWPAFVRRFSLYSK